MNIALTEIKRGVYPGLRQLYLRVPDVETAKLVAATLERMKSPQIPQAELVKARNVGSEMIRQEREHPPQRPRALARHRGTEMSRQMEREAMARPGAPRSQSPPRREVAELFAQAGAARRARSADEVPKQDPRLAFENAPKYNATMTERPGVYMVWAKINGTSPWCAIASLGTDWSRQRW